jgi:hypothetical protein
MTLYPTALSNWYDPPEPPPHPVNDCQDPDCDCGFDPDTAPGGHDDY